MDRSAPSRPSLGVVVFLALAIGMLALAAVAAVAAYEWRYSSRIYEGVYASGIPVGGLTLDEAQDAVLTALTPYPGAAVTLQYGEQTWQLSAADLGITINAAATAAEAFSVGRRGSSYPGDPWLSLWADMRADLITQWTALRQGVYISPTLNLNEDQLALTLRRVAQAVDLPAQEGMLVISGLEVNGLPGRVGRQVDYAGTWDALLVQAKSGAGGTTPLIVHERRPAVMAVDSAITQAKTLLGRSLTLAAEGLNGTQYFAVDAAQLRQWLTMTPVAAATGTVELKVALDRDQVTRFVEALAEQINQPAYDAVLDFDPQAGQVIVLQPSQPGQALDVAGSVAAIEAALAQPAAAEAEQITPEQVPLVIERVSPRVDSDRIAEMGIMEQISEGTTFFAGSSAERVHNIVNTIEKFHGVVIPPGEQFSFYQVVGDVTLANGFVDSLIIVGDRTEVGVGGGVCQVSTTVFRAAFWAGLPILERYAHGYVVGWYGEPGWDASIFTPDADFRFLNDTGHYILIQPEIDLRKGRLTFHIYGTRDRSVAAEKGVITNVRPAPQALYREDPYLPAGTIKQVDWAKEGMDVTVKRIISFTDGRAKEDRFVSRYRPWQAVFLYGPGAALPPEAQKTP